MLTAINLYSGSNTQDIEVVGVKYDDTGDAIEDATVTITITDITGAVVSGASLPLTLVHQSDGTYTTKLDAGAAIVANQEYSVKLNVVADNGNLEVEQKVTAQTRSGG